MINYRLSFMMFLQFFIWGGWFVTLGTFLASNLSASGAQSGMAFSTQSWGAIIAPFIIGLIADRYFPEFYEAFVDTLADTIQASLEDLQPAEVAHVMSSCSEAHEDRRCEDGRDYENPSLPVLAVRRDAEVQALVMSYAVHGTVLGIDDLYLSQDVSGAIEEAVEDRFDHPVEALLFNGWGADMAPATPTVDMRAGASQPSGFDKMDAIGEVVAEAVLDPLDRF